MKVRKSATKLTAIERDKFLAAVLTLKNTIANPTAPVANQISIYDQFVAIHLEVLRVVSVGSGGVPVNTGHGGAGFCPWHREYLLRFEQALQAVDPDVTLPYWDWTDHDGSENILFQDSFIGPGRGSTNNEIASGYFAFNAPGTGGNPTPLPAWWPVGLAGWQIRASLSQASGTTLRRDIDHDGGFPYLTTAVNVRNVLKLPTTPVNPASDYNRFRADLESTGTRMHDYIHVWTGGATANGHMRNQYSSPNDPIFFLHHCNIDRLWAMWQINNHQGSAYYPSSGQAYGHNLNEPMWPWVGALTGFSSDNHQPDIVLPDFSGVPQRRPVDVIDHRALGYSYDTEVVIGIALDQTGSMNGLTPDPLTGMTPNISKWLAAKQGVAALLHDCETAFEAAEAYIIAGVETFRNTGANVFTPVFPGNHYGLIKLGDPVFSEVGFTSAIGAFAPGGGTPLAGAITDTETNTVRTPFAGLPLNDDRYMFFFTDGIETSPPNLSTLTTHQYPDTTIFAMGFGIGSGGNGVDYTTIANIVSKGKDVPAGVQQVYHGENAGEINKFFTNSIARVIGYTPTVDPIYEIFAGEHVDTPFYVNSFDQSIMISAQAFDYTDDNWQFCLMTPSGEQCNCDSDCDTGHDHEEGEHEHTEPADEHSDDTTKTGLLIHEHNKVLVTSNKKNGRITVFISRNGAADKDWNGLWQFRAMYKMKGTDMAMFMPGVWDLLYPAGALPIAGQVYAKYKLPVSKRPAQRLLPLRNKKSVGFPRQGVSSKTNDACSLSVNIYNKTSLQTVFIPGKRKYTAGQKIDLSLIVTDKSNSKIQDIKVVSRMIAPAFSLGNVFADKKIIPLNKRNAFYSGKKNEVKFDQLKFLAEVETRKPSYFQVTDEIINFTSEKNKAKTTLPHSKFPGIYHVTVLAEGKIMRENKRPEHFTRILSLEIPVGIDIDGKASKTELKIKSKRELLLTMFLRDEAGNIPMPGDLSFVTVKINNKLVNAETKNNYDGSLSFIIKMESNNLAFTRDKKIKAGEMTIMTRDNKKLSLKKADFINFSIDL